MKTKVVAIVVAAAALLLVVIVATTTSDTKGSRAHVQGPAPDASTPPKAASTPPKAASTLPKVPSFTGTETADGDEAVRNVERALSGQMKEYTPPRQERLLYATMGRKHEFQASEIVLQQMGLPEEKLDRLRKFLTTEIAVIVELTERYIDHPDQRTIDGGPPAEQRRERVYAMLQKELGDRYPEFRSAQMREQRKLSREYVRKHNLRPSLPPP